MQFLALRNVVYRSLALLAVVLVAFLASGCGDDAEEASPATEWANDVCTAIVSWRDSITSTADSLRVGVPTADALRGAVDDLESATRAFVDDVRGLGMPDTDTGAEAKESLDELADTADESLTTMQTAVGNASGVAGVVEAATAISTGLSTLGAQLSSTFEELEDLDAEGELEEAFSEADSCDELEN